MSTFSSGELTLADGIEELRDSQYQALDWALSQDVPYLFLNAPTGIGKTLINAVYGLASREKWTYGVHTIRLQQQVAETLLGLPVLTGRSNHPCLIGGDIYPGESDVTADRGICAVGEWCQHSGRAPSEGDDRQSRDLCDYYDQLFRARDGSDFRVANYSMILALAQGLPLPARVMLADEAHNIEDVVCNNASVKLNYRTFKRHGLTLPSTLQLEEWMYWADEQNKVDVRRRPPDLGAKTVNSQLKFLASLTPEQQGEWLIEEDEYGVQFQPIWGSKFVMRDLFGHNQAPPGADFYDLSTLRWRGLAKVLMTSATLMGAEYIAEKLGLPEDSWAYLDLPSVFPVKNRPINFSPVMRMNYKSMSTEEGRKPMQDAMDRGIGYYLANGAKAGLIHSVSNRYREQILHESLWRDIMVIEEKAHAERVAAGKPSVLVAANLTEGWDGYDNLCRFVFMPKVPYPSLGDKRTSLRREEDPRSYDWSTLVSVVQGAGRGVRHSRDYCDTWMFDENWRFLYGNRGKEWLPDSFLSAYNHRVQLPW